MSPEASFQVPCSHCGNDVIAPIYFISCSVKPNMRNMPQSCVMHIICFCTELPHTLSSPFRKAMQQQ